MSDKYVPYHQRDVMNPPSHLDPTQQHKWIRTAEKAKRNYRLRQQHPPFDIPTTIYQVQFINRYTTVDTLKLLIDHVEKCQEYTIDTEGDKSTHETVLIQIETIPKQLPKIVIILELTHLPSHESSRKVLVKKFLRLIFRSGNTLHSWGNLQYELSSVKQKELLDYPIEAFQYDIQALFDDWYTWARSRCGVRDPSNYEHVEDNDILSMRTKNSLGGCICHEPSPYRLNEKWSLQRSLIYVNAGFIDKSITINDWSTLLDPLHTKLSRSTHEARIRYLIYDCFATTYFIKSVLAYWTFKKLKETNIVELFTSSTQVSSIIKSNRKGITNNINKINKSNKITKNIDGQTFKNVLDNDIELISDEEDEVIVANRCISSIINNDGVYEIILNNNDIITPSSSQYVQDFIEPEVYKIKLVHKEQYELQEDNDNDKEVIISDQEQGDKSSSTKPRIPKHQTRSADARRKRNKQRNVTHRRNRYRYSILRPIYHRFTMEVAKNILRQYRIYFIHVKVIVDDLVIGLKNQSVKDRAEHELPRNIFNRQGYYHYRRLNQHQ